MICYKKGGEGSAKALFEKARHIFEQDDCVSGYRDDQGHSWHSPLRKIRDNYEKLVIAWDCNLTQTQDGIRIVRALDFWLFPVNIDKVLPNPSYFELDCINNQVIQVELSATNQLRSTAVIGYNIHKRKGESLCRK